MFWTKSRTVREGAAMNDPQVIEILEEITDRLNSTSAQLRDFSTELQSNIKRLKRYADEAEKKVQGN